MRLVAHNRFSNPVNVTFTELVVYDDNDNVVAAVVQHDQNMFEIVHARDKEFRKVLTVLGLDKLAPDVITVDPAVRY